VKVIKTVQEMLGEFLREAAVLVAVFGFLDRVLANQLVTLGHSIAVTALSGFLFMSGVVVELSRRR
jgi:hypothetical protein